MKSFLQYTLVSLLVLLLSCQEEGPQDTQTAGSIQISVDETYKPVMEEQLKVFRSRYPNANILVSYKSESACVQDLLEDTTRVIFITRDLSQQEKDYALTKQIVTRSLPMARDAIAFITSQQASRKTFTLQEIKAICEGKDSSMQLVFDNQGSSTVRYITDSLIPGKTLSTNSFAAKGGESVIDYIASNPKALGVIGVSWVADHSDSTTESFLNKISVAGIKPDTPAGSRFIKPYQAYIGLREYPCTRNFYFISKETWPGLGTGLVNFLCRDGQLVFKTAKMFPLQVNVVLREANAKE